MIDRLMKLPRFVRPPVPPVRSDVRIVSLTAVMAYVQGYAFAQAANNVPFIRRSLAETAAQMSLLLAITRMGAIAAVVLSLAGDRGGRRRILLFSYGVMAVASAATATADTALWFTVWQSITRMTGSSVSVLSLVMLAETLQPGLRAYGIAVFGAAVSFGAGSALVAVPINDLGPDMWRVLFAVTLLGLLALPALVKRVAESPLFGSGSVESALWAPLRGGAARRFWPVAAVSFLAAAFAATASSFSMERLVDNLGLSTIVAVLILAIGGTVGGIGFFAGGRLADTWGRRPTTAMALLSAGVGGIGLYRLESPGLLVLAAALSGFGAFAIVPSLGALRNEVFPTSIRATAAMWLNSAGVMGAVFGLALGKYLIGNFGLSTTVTLLSIGMAVAALLMMLVPETKGLHLTPNVSPIA
ncbi:MAG: MFS transporter [Acidimicrobiia bacterium]